MVARKDPDVRARNNPENRPFKIVETVRVEQPPLPAGFPYDGRRIKWPEQTLTWWAHWKESVLTSGFTEHDWDYLLDTAVYHAKHWLGLDSKAGAELRQRLAKFGVTPEDRAKLRIVLVDAENKEEMQEKYGRLNEKVPTVGNSRRLTAIEGFEDAG